jgi:hypothetical protein
LLVLKAIFQLVCLNSLAMNVVSFTVYVKIDRFCLGLLLLEFCRLL